MRLDIPTLAIVTVFVTALLGALLIFAGLQNRAVRAPVTWGIAFILCALGTALVAVRGTVPDWVSIQVANVVVLVGLGLIWTGARQFDGRTPRTMMVTIAPAIWLAACAVPSILADINARIMIASSLAAIISFAIAYEVWRGRAERLLSRWPAVLTLMLYGAVMLARVPLAYVMPQPQGAYQLTDNVLYPLLSFGTLLFGVVLAFLLLNMAKERTELRHKTASLIDPLTGIANRRAFFAGAEKLAVEPPRSSDAMAVLLFDLDHFKVINDRFGHAAGDAVLISFATTATHVLGPGTLFGRIGGEEFGAAIRVSGLGEALALAEQVRQAFKASGRGADIGPDLAPTVSIGVALQDDVATTLTMLMAAADQALYRAKEKGRNRVASASVAVADAVPPATEGERRSWRKLPASA